MCGLAGFACPGGFDDTTASDWLDDMAAAITHRGPDDSGSWLDASSGVALGHRRLAIVDVSSTGHQPMQSASGRYVIVYNGEIYNHLDLRDEIGDHAWRGTSDTETLLAAIDRFGLRGALAKSTGMFALALWDRETKSLSLARDRMGEKPLYYGWQHGTLLFASELAALRRHPHFSGVIDRRAVAEYFERGYVPAPRSIYANIRKLPPGTLMTLSQAELAAGDSRPETYWALHDVARAGLERPLEGDLNEAIERLDSTLRASVLRQTIADVPLGAFLSGGIDSTTIVAMLQDQTPQPVKTFTIGFEDARYDESPTAAAIAKYLGTDHTSLTVGPEMAMDIVPRLPQMFGEPFGDSSAIPTALVSQMAREQVKVSLSGDGGDELFGGYSRHRQWLGLWRKMTPVPWALRQLASKAGVAASRLPLGARASRRLNRLGHLLSASSYDDYYQMRFSAEQNDSRLVLGKQGLAASDRPVLQGLEPLDSMMYADAMDYLPNDILTKVDRAAMHVSLESRVPLLSHDVVELGWQLPADMKMREGVGKWVLREVLKKYVPVSLTDRPKKGFGVPVGQWLRGPLRDWGEELFDSRQIKEDGLLDVAIARSAWENHLRGQCTSDDAIWPLVVFLQWLKSIRTADA